jgi:hypothetical protein
MTTSNGSGPLRAAPGSRISRRLRFLIGGIVALVIAAALVAPVVLMTGRGTSGSKPCAETLFYGRHEYVARPVTPGVVEGVAIGVGVTSGCGAAPSNINIRSLVGVKPTAAVGLPGDASAIYVRRGVCSQAVAGALLGCVSSRG